MRSISEASTAQEVAEQPSTGWTRKITLLVIGVIGLLAVAAGCSYCFGYGKHLVVSTRMILAGTGGVILSLALGIFCWDCYKAYRG